MATKVDYIIVGLGLAGACLAMQLIKRGFRVVVYDLPGQNRASAVAAGLFNPITGKRIVKTWKADEIFSCLFEFYSGLEMELGTRFFYPTPLYTPFKSVEEQNEWMGKSADPAFAKYILDITTQSTYGNEVRDPFGGILLSQCGYVKVNVLLESVRKILIQTGSYRQENWDERKLIIAETEVGYEDLMAQKVILCTGIHLLASKFSIDLPLKPLRGEVITIKTSKALNRIYNRGVYLLEQGNMEYKVGATYDLTGQTDGVSEEGKKELVQKAKDLLNVSFVVTHQDWGIRPSTVDRRPLIGEHPSSKNILIFNGLGTKGVSLAPYFSGQLAKYLSGLGNLDKEANISRVKSLY